VKLISLYIENFGGLHRFSLNFEAGITSIVQPNGFGKSTLAEFIRAMFYGFPRKSKTLDRSRRQKYMPWNGGQFGGNLVFEHEGQRYRIERTFGTNPKGDTFSLIDLGSNRKTTRFTEEIGQELFGVDTDSFERSVYLPQLRENGSFATASIQAKLSDLVEDSGDVMGFDKAMAALRAERSALIPYRGSGGRVAETAANIHRLQLQLEMLQTQEVQLRTAQEEAVLAQQDVAKIKNFLAQTAEQLQLTTQQETDHLHRQQYMQLCSRLSKAETVLETFRKKYSSGLPQEDALYRAELAAERLKQYGDNASEIEPVPTVDRLDACRRLCKEYAVLQARLHDMQLRVAETAQEQMQHPVSLPDTFSKVPTAALVCGAAGVMVGAALVLLKGWTYGTAVLVAGALLLAAGTAARCIQSRKRHRFQRELHWQKQAAEGKLAQLQVLTDELRVQTDACRKKIATLFAEAGLRVMPEQYSAALAELERRNTRAAEQAREASAARAQLQTFLSGLGIPNAQNVHQALQQLREDVRAIQAAQALAQTLKEQLAAMEEACGEILFADDLVLQDPQQLRQEERQLRMELTAATTRMLQAEQTVLRLREEISKLPSVREELEQEQQKFMAAQEKAKLLDTTMVFLQQARENLSTAYMGTIRSRFGYYLSMLGSGDEKYLVDSELQVQLERQGQARALAYFSAGQTDLVMLCMRLALVDALFRDQEMFVILDDPFVNLDDARMEQARVLLHKLASERQILYLACHSGRTV